MLLLVRKVFEKEHFTALKSCEIYIFKMLSIVYQ